MDLLETLYAEQTTPDEVVVFLLLGTVMTLVFAFIVYALILLILSRIRMRDGLTLWTLLFPSAGRLRKYAAEYTLGTFTALLLGLTVSMKHDTVEMILQEDISTIGYEKVREALQFGQLSRQELEDQGASPENAELIMSWLEDGVVRPGLMDVESMIQPLLASGMTENANLVVRAVVGAVEPNNDLEVLRNTLLGASVVLLLGYVFWFSTQRWREMQRDQSREPAYATILKRLSLPAVCIPLLFVSAVALEDSGRMIDSAIASAATTEPERPEPLVDAIGEVATNGVDPGDLDELNQRLNELSGQIDDLSRELLTLSRSVADTRRGQDQAIAGTNRNLESHITNSEQRFANLEAAIEELKQGLDEAFSQWEGNIRRAIATGERAAEMARQNGNRIEELENAMEELRAETRRAIQLAGRQSSQPTLLFVQNFQGNRTFQIRRNNSNSPIASGRYDGLYPISPGTYDISGDGACFENDVTVTEGEITTVNLRFCVQ